MHSNRSVGCRRGGVCRGFGDGRILVWLSVAVVRGSWLDGCYVFRFLALVVGLLVRLAIVLWVRAVQREQSDGGERDTEISGDCSL